MATLSPTTDRLSLLRRQLDEQNGTIAPKPATTTTALKPTTTPTITATPAPTTSTTTTAKATTVPTITATPKTTTAPAPAPAPTIDPARQARIDAERAREAAAASGGSMSTGMANPGAPGGGINVGGAGNRGNEGGITSPLPIAPRQPAPGSGTRAPGPVGPGGMPINSSTGTLPGAAPGGQVGAPVQGSPPPPAPWGEGGVLNPGTSGPPKAAAPAPRALEALEEDFIRSLLEGVNNVDTSEQEALIREEMDRLMGQGLVNSRARAGFMGMESSGGQLAAEGGIRADAARGVSRDILDTRGKAKQQAIDNAFGGIGADVDLMTAAQDAELFDMIMGLLGQDGGEGAAPGGGGGDTGAPSPAGGGPLPGGLPGGDQVNQLIGKSAGGTPLAQGGMPDASTPKGALKFAKWAEALPTAAGKPANGRAVYSSGEYTIYVVSSPEGQSYVRVPNGG